MLSICNVSSPSQAMSYYERDDYYAVREGGYDAANWAGRGAERLVLEGVVDRDRFRELLSGRVSEAEQIPGGPGGERRAGIDLTFSVPKSVSLMALVGQDERLMDAHDRAVGRAMDYMEREAAQVRVVQGGQVEYRRTGEFVVAQFRHDTSRPVEGRADPNLHTHNVVVNASYDRESGKWRALSNEEIYRHKMAAGVVYRAELAREVQRLGYDVEKTHADGRFEIKGFERTQIEEFSQRRQVIEKNMEERGVGGAEGAARAAVYSRESKAKLSPEQLRADWGERARVVGIDFEQIRGQQVERELVLERGAARSSLDYAIQHLGERQSVLMERDIVRHALEHGTGRVTLDELRGEISSARRTRELLDVDAERGRYTTVDALHREGHTLRIAGRGKGTFEPVAPIEKIDQCLADFREREGVELTAGQRAAVDLVLTSSDRVVAVQGYAGTGKTAMLAFVNEVAVEQGYEVRGFAPSATAAKVLESEAGIRSQTLEKHLVSREPSGGGPQLWVVDECSMMSAKDAHRLFVKAERENARLVLVGDREQLPAIQAGKPFAVLCDRSVQVAEMREIMRQQEGSALRQAVEHTLEGREQDALSKLDVREIVDQTERWAAVARDFLAQSQADRDRSVVLVQTNAQRREISGQIREGLAREGVFRGDEARVGVLVNRHLTSAQVRESAHYQEGDVVRFTREYKSLGTGKGEHLRVVGADYDQNCVTLERVNGDRVEWQPHRLAKAQVYTVEDRALRDGDRIRWTLNDYGKGRRNGELGRVVSVDQERGLAAVVGQDGKAHTVDLRAQQHLEHAYATTLHGAQGGTWDRYQMLLETSQQSLLSRESFYVGITRGREDGMIYTDDARQLPREIAQSKGQESAIEAREQYLGDHHGVERITGERSRDFGSGGRGVERGSADCGQDLDLGR